MDYGEAWLEARQAWALHEFEDLLETWAPHCGAPRSVFAGQWRIMMDQAWQAGYDQGYHDKTEEVRTTINSWDPFEED